jgi:hypothetical protein
MATFHAYAGSEKHVSFDMPDRKMMEAFEKWLTDKKELDHFIGSDNHGKRVALSFPLLMALVEPSPPAAFGQGSQALAGRPLVGS